MTMAKFSGTMGYTLTQNSTNDVLDLPSTTKEQDKLNITLEELTQRNSEILNVGSIPEFVKIENLLDFYKIMTEANLKN